MCAVDVNPYSLNNVGYVNTVYTPTRIYYSVISYCIMYDRHLSRPNRMRSNKKCILILE